MAVVNPGARISKEFRIFAIEGKRSAGDPCNTAGKVQRRRAPIAGIAIVACDSGVPGYILAIPKPRQCPRHVATETVAKCSRDTCGETVDPADSDRSRGRLHPVRES